MSASRKTSVVIVDDEPTIVRVAEKVLRDHFGEELAIFTTTDSTAALDHISQRRCDILLSDIEMPGIHGLEMLKSARQYNTWTRVVFITGHSTWDLIAEAIENGAADYLVKPLDHDQLIHVVTQERERLARWHDAVRGALQAVAVEDAFPLPDDPLWAIE